MALAPAVAAAARASAFADASDDSRRFAAPAPPSSTVRAMAGAVDAFKAAAVACAVPAPKTQAFSFLDQLPPSDASSDLARNVPLPVTNTPSSPASWSVSSATRGAFFSFSLPSLDAVDFLGFFSALGLASLFFLGAGLGLGLGLVVTGAAFGCNSSAFFSLNSCSLRMPSSNKALASRRAWTVSASIALFGRCSDQCVLRRGLRRRGNGALLRRRVGWRRGAKRLPAVYEPRTASQPTALRAEQAVAVLKLCE